MVNATLRHRLHLLALAALPACGSDLVLPTPSAEGLVLAVFDGNEQTGPVGEQLPQPLVVKVEAQGAPAADFRVAFTIVDGPSGLRVAPDTAMTDEDGLAATTVLLGTETGDYQIEATLVVPQPQPPPMAVFEGAAVAASPDTIRAAAPLLQSGRRGEPVEDTPTVVVVDRFGNPAAGAEVEWQVTVGGGQVSGTTVDAEGRATAIWTLGNGVGIQKLEAGVEGAHGSPIVFSAAVLF